MSSQAVKRAAVYIRVSTLEQARHGTGLDVQRQSLVQEAERQGMQIVEFCEDRGVSGTKYVSRPGIQTALALIETGKADVLLATKIDRLGRSAGVVLDIVKRVQAAGGEVITGDYKFDRSAMGQFTLTMFAGLAEMEHANIRERSMSGRRQRAIQGQQTAVLSPYGYHIVRRDDVLRGDYLPEQIGKYVIVPSEAEIVKQAFERYAAGATSLPKLADELNAAHVPTPKGGATWRSTTFRAFFRNRVYIGEAGFGKWETGSDERRLDKKHPITGKPITSAKYVRPASPENLTPLIAPAIISEAVWDAVQRKMQANQQKRGGNPGRARMLSGKTVCPACGGSMFLLHNRAGYGPYLACGRNRAHRRDFKTDICIKDYFEVASHEQATIRAIMALTEFPELIEVAIQNYRKSRESLGNPDGIREELIKIDKALAALQARQTATVQAQVSGILAGAEPSAYDEAFAHIAAERKDLEDRRGSLSKALRERNEITSEDSDEAIQRQVLIDVQRALTSPFLTGEEKRDLTARVVDKVICDKVAPIIQYAPGVLSQETLHNSTE